MANAKKTPLSEPAASRAVRKANILLVDDHEENLLAMEAVLADLGQNLVKARSGTEALKALLHDDFAVVLLDVQMPEMDGFETAALIRARERSRHTPIIFMTAVSKGEVSIYKGYAVGAVDYILKPFGQEVLRAKVAVFVDLFVKTELVKEQGERLRQLEGRRHRRELAAVTAQRDRFFDLSLDLLGVVGFDGLIKELNPPWETALGLPNSELPGAAFADFVHPEDRRAFLEQWAPLSRRPGSAVTAECRFSHRDGSSRWLWWSATAFSDEKVYYIAARDITDRRLAEENVRRLNEDLDRRVTERTAQLKAANDELEAFSYSVSHDLKAPLRKIEGFSRLLLEHSVPQLDAEGQRLFGVIRANVERMGQLIEDLLAFSRLGRAESEASQVDMRALAEAVVDELRKAEPSRGVASSVGPLPPALADGGMIRQVFFNLVSNAFKFTRAQKHPEVEIGAEAGPEQNVYWVKDNGAGFDMRYVGQLFRVFQRLHSAVDFEGTGIGLALVQRIVSRHGGRVWAEGSEGRGAAFYFTLPRGG